MKKWRDEERKKRLKPSEKLGPKEGGIFSARHFLDEIHHFLFIARKTGFDGEVVGGMIGGKIASAKIGMGDHGAKLFQELKG